MFIYIATIEIQVEADTLNDALSDADAIASKIDELEHETTFAEVVGVLRTGGRQSQPDEDDIPL